MRAMGLPVWARHRRVCLFVVRTNFVRAFRPQFLRYRDEILQAHCPRGGIVTSKKFLGVGPLGENFFPNFFRDIDLKICVCNARDPGKTRLKNFHDRTHRGRAVAMNVRACRQGPREPAWRLSRVLLLLLLVTFSHVTVTGK